MTSVSDLPPPPYSPPRTRSHLPGYARQPIPRFNRRAKSESWVVPHDSSFDDNDFLANLAAIQLLTGCTMIPRRHVFSGSHHSIDIYSGDDDGLPDLTLHMISTLSVPVPRKSTPTAKFRSRRNGLRASLRIGADGHMSHPSDESARRFTRAYSAPMTRSLSRDQVRSEELDRRLSCIDEALQQNRGRLPSRRMKTSEVVRREQSEANEDDTGVDSVVQVSAALAAWRYVQHRDLSQCSGVLYPSPALSEMACSSQSASESQTPRRSTLEDRSNMKFDRSLKDRISRRIRSHNQSSRYNVSRESTPHGQRRRHARRSSVYMSSAESSPLFNTPTSAYQGHLPNPLSHVQPDVGRNSVNPLAATSLEVATNQLDRLASRVEEATNLRRAADARHGSPNMSGQSSEQSMKSATPDVKALFVSGTITDSVSTKVTSAMLTPTSPPATPQNTPMDGVGTPRDNITGALHALRRYRRRKTSSKLSEIYTYEGIPEAFEEEVFLSVSTSPYGPTRSGTGSRTGGQPCSFASPHSPYGLGTSRRGGISPDTKIDPVDQAFEKALLTQDQPPKVVQGHSEASRSKTPGLHVEFAEPLSECAKTQTSESPNERYLSPGYRPFLRSTSSYPSLSGDTRVDLACLGGGSTNLVSQAVPDPAASSSNDEAQQRLRAVLDGDLCEPKSVAGPEYE